MSDLRETNVVVIGAGAHGRRVAEAIAASGGTVVAFASSDAVDRDADGSAARPFPVPTALARFPGVGAVVAIGNGAVRAALSGELERAGAALLRIVHPRATVSPSAVLGAGVVVLAGAAIDAGACVEAGGIVDVGAIVAHDARVGAWAHLRPGCIVAPRGHVPAHTVVGYGRVVCSEGED